MSWDFTKNKFGIFVSFPFSTLRSERQLTLSINRSQWEIFTVKLRKPWTHEKFQECLLFGDLFTIMFRTREQTSKPQTNYRCCLRFGFLVPYWLFIFLFASPLKRIENIYHVTGKHNWVCQHEPFATLFIMPSSTKWMEIIPQTEWKLGNVKTYSNKKWSKLCLYNNNSVNIQNVLNLSYGSMQKATSKRKLTTPCHWAFNFEGVGNSSMKQ